MCDNNLFPNPSPLEAPFTRPAMSTKDIVVFIFFLESEILTTREAINLKCRILKFFRLNRNH